MMHQFFCIFCDDYTNDEFDYTSGEFVDCMLSTLRCKDHSCGVLCKDPLRCHQLLWTVEYRTAAAGWGRSYLLLLSMHVVLVCHILEIEGASQPSFGHLSMLRFSNIRELKEVDATANPEKTFENRTFCLSKRVIAIRLTSCLPEKQ